MNIHYGEKMLSKKLIKRSENINIIYKYSSLLNLISSKHSASGMSLYNKYLLNNFTLSKNKPIYDVINNKFNFDNILDLVHLGCPIHYGFFFILVN